MAIRTVSFFRHGKTNKADKGQSDESRRLNEEGRAQAQRRRELIGHPHFDAGFCSSRVRTRETLDILAGRNDLPTMIVPELFHDQASKDGELLDAAFEKLGYASIGEYMSKSDAATQAALVNYGQGAWHSLVQAMKCLPKDATDVIVVGHAILLGLIIQEAVHVPSEAVNRINFAECEGAKLRFDEAGDCTGIVLLLV